MACYSEGDIEKERLASIFIPLFPMFKLSHQTVLLAIIEFDLACLEESSCNTLLPMGFDPIGETLHLQCSVKGFEPT